MNPIKIENLGIKGIKITWENGAESTIQSKLLRNHCPCAQCRMDRGDNSHSAPLTPSKSKSLLKIIEHTQQESLTLSKIFAVGGYAIGLAWQDGHDSGIYTYELLNNLGNFAPVD